MNTYFQNKVIWLTGASSGIGEALVYALAKEQPKLILSSRKRAELERVATQSGLPPENIFILPLDLAEHQKIGSLTQEVIKKFGRIDILINNAGLSQRSEVIETDLAVDQQIMNVNFLGTIALTKAVLPFMIEDEQGQIISVASIAGEVATPKRSSYAAAKAAVIRFMDALRAEVHEHDIHIGVINPGYVRTNISLNALTGDGTPQATMDSRTDQGLAVDVFAQRMLKAIRKNKDEVYIAGPLELFAVYMKRFFPSILRVMIRKIASS